jgi:hypothetical protein
MAVVPDSGDDSASQHVFLLTCFLSSHLIRSMGGGKGGADALRSTWSVTFSRTTSTVVIDLAALMTSSPFDATGDTQQHPPPPTS